MTALPSPGTAASGTSGSHHIQSIPGFNCSSPLQLSSSAAANNNNNNKRKRRPAGTPDPDAEVVALSPKTLMESDRYVCEICNQGFQRDQNLQMHRRRHKVPWKLLKRPTPEIRKRVYVCPDPTCLHNDPCHALGDLVGIKKHFRRKHSIEKQWKCEKCSKGYAVQSDYKAHLKTCGTRGHSCDCGRVFSRVESFIEHQDNCNAAKERATFGYSDPPSLPSLTGRTSSSNDTFSANRSGISSAGRPFESTKFQDQAWLKVNQRERQFLPAKNKPNTSETTLQGAVTNVGAAVLFRDHIKIPITHSPSAPIEPIRSSTSEEDMFENAPGLQLSIGLRTDYKIKSPVRTDRRPKRLTLPEDISSWKPVDHEETGTHMKNGDPSGMVTGAASFVGRRNNSQRNQSSSEMLWAPAQMMVRRDSSLLYLPWISGQQNAATESLGSKTEMPSAQSDIAGAELLKRQAREQLRQASQEKASAEQARDLAKRQIELAEAEFATAKRLQEQARAQLAHAQQLKEQATRRIDETRLEITCQACRQQFMCHVNAVSSSSNGLQLELQSDFQGCTNDPKKEA
ncbi:hypothetical protein SUGI_0311160 [Cryptomeria japonica]|nr:hypothetical protein SUGI_0311160 [Cryptomeria japonica]